MAENIESDNKFVIYAEYQRSKKEIMDRYYNLLNSYNKYVIQKNLYGRIDRISKINWIDSFRQLCLIMRPYINIPDDWLITSNCDDVRWLEDKTKKITNSRIICQVTSIGSENNHDNPIIEYARSNYNDYELKDLEKVDKYIESVNYD